MITPCRLRVAILTLILFATSAGATATRRQEAKAVIIYVDGRNVGRGISYHGITYVPVRAVAESLGVSVRLSPTGSGAVFLSTPLPGGGNRAAEETAARWVNVTDFEGESTKNTKTFVVKARKWRIHWEFSTEGKSSGVFSINVHKVSTDRDVALIANTNKSGDDTGYVYESGEFYLDISAIGKYKITVEQFQ